jgi:hypothetical protein
MDLSGNEFQVASKSPRLGAPDNQRAENLRLMHWPPA